MSKINLNADDKIRLVEAMNDGIEPSPDLLPKLFPGIAEKFDVVKLDRAKVPTLEYAGKRSKAAILAEASAGSGPLQIERSFGDVKEDEWKNLIIQGDNLQFLKTCYKNEDPLIKDKVKGKVKLIYIDPPFGTGDEYGGRDGTVSYSAKLMGAEFIEMVRERLVLLRELLSEDGFIVVRQAYNFGFQIKILMDELFYPQNFRNEIIINKANQQGAIQKRFNPSTEFLFLYSRNTDTVINPLYVERGKKPTWINAHSPKENTSSHTIVYKGGTFISPKGRHWTFSQKRIDELDSSGRIKLVDSGYIDVYGNNQNRMIQYLMDDKKTLDSNWTDIPAYSFSTGYPTENSEQLLERVVNAFSNQGSLIIDVFGGSGTTPAVAEKLDRRWISCDFGKHAIYTQQKRILNIFESKALQDEVDKNNKVVIKKGNPYGHTPKPFCVASVGAYDFSHVMSLREHKDRYIDFVLGLFQLSKDKKVAHSYKLANIFAEKEKSPVEVYPVWQDEYLKEIRIDEDYLQAIIDQAGPKISGDYYIIAPETCSNIGETILKNGSNKVTFHILSFPYKVLEDASRHFTLHDQPSAQDDVNKLITSTAFYFNEDVGIKVKRNDVGFEIEEFKTNILDKEGKPFSGFDGIAMVLVDQDYDSKKPFDMDETIFAKDIKEGRVKIKLTKSVAIIAIDKHGNESKPIKI